MKRSARRFTSFLLTCLLLFGMLPEISLPARAATNLAGGFEGQDADVFSALGFDTSEIPEGYNEDTTENPYGRDLVPGNQVFELVTASSSGANVYGRDDDSFSFSDINSMPTGAAMPSGMQLFAAAAGDFDGDGLPGGIAYAGITGTSGDQALYLYFYDAEAGNYGEAMQICSAINPTNTVPGGDANQASYAFAWQNLLQITAGDYDGDGTAEIAVYVAENAAARVDIYKYQRTSLSGEKDWLNPQSWSRVWSHALSKDTVPNMVSLESGDFNRDGVDDLAIASGSLVFSEQHFLGANGFIASSFGLRLQYSQASTATILWGAKSRMLQSHDGLDLNNAELGEQSRVGFAYGDLDGDGVKDLIAVGQPLSDATSNTSRTITSYVYANGAGMTINSSAIYKVVDGKWEEIQSGTDDNGQPTYTQAWTSSNGFDSEYNSLPLMVSNAAVMTPAGSDYTYLYADSCLYRYSEGQMQIFYALDEESGQYSSENTDDRLDNSWRLSITSGITDRSYGFCEYGAVSGDVNGSGSDILSTALISPQNTSASSRNNGVFTLWGSGDGVTLDNAVAQNFASGFIVPSLVDVDLDTIIIEYTGVHYLTYSDPQVLAVIAAAPYFEDVDEVVDYDYAWQNTTSYSRIQGQGHSEIITMDFEAGAWLEADTTLGGASVAIETAVLFTLEWEESTTKTTEYELSFETSQDEDAVAFFSIPTENYVYNIHTPDGKGGYTTTVDIIQNTFTPCYQILTLDYYESIQGNYDELPQISGTALTSTPGDPASYPSSTNGYNVIAQWNDDPAGVSFGNGSISQSITITEEQAESYNIGGAWDFQVGGGGAFQSDLLQTEVEVAGGIQWSLNPASGWADIDLTGTSFSGTVTNMPLQFRDYGYYYSWKLFAYNYVFDNGNSIPVVSYLVNDVSAPPELPEDFQQDFDLTTSEENVLTWTYDGAATKFYLYKYFDFPVGGGLDLIAEIDPADSRFFKYQTDGDGNPYKQYYYTDPNLTPYTEYQYAIQVERIDKVPPLSSPSGLLTARTKAAEGYPLLYISESDNISDGTLLVYPDKNSYLTVDVKGPQGENSSNYYSIVQYQWQKLEKGSWVDMVNETGMTLTFSNAGVDTAGSYRCRVNVLTRDTATYITAYTGTVVLTHAKRTSYIDETTLGVEDVTGGGIQLYAQVRNAHADSAAIPGGSASFILTNTSTGDSYTYIAELDATGTASKILDGTLPQGMYTVAVRYSGSYIFKSCSADCTYLSQMSSGYTIDLPSSITYGDGADVTFYHVSKSDGITSHTQQQANAFSLQAAEASSRVAISTAGYWDHEFSPGQKLGSLQAGQSYRYRGPDGAWLYFTVSRSGTVRLYEDYVTYEYIDASSYLTYTNEGGQYALSGETPAGTYLVRMQGEDTEPYTEALFTVNPRPVSLQLPHQQGNEGTPAVQPTLGELTVAGGSWAPCDFNADGTLKQSIADTVANTKYYNTAWKEFTHESVCDVCGFYTICCADTLANYDLTFLDGSITILGATQEVSIGVRPFEDQQVGTLYAVSPDYAYTRTSIGTTGSLTQKHPTGTRLVFSAVPDTGYEIYDWYINGKPLGSKDSSIAYVLLNEPTSVEVQFSVKQNTLSFGTAGDAGGGTITCSDESLTSGSVVIANALFTFTAVPNEGYHFKEWRYTELDQGTVYDDTDFGKESSTFELIMPSTSCSVYAVFERDFYPFTFTDRSGNNGLVAWYENRVNDAPGAPVEKIFIESGQEIKGDTVVTIEPAQGCTWDADYRYVSSGSQGTADYSTGTYVVTVDAPTDVTGYTRRNAYDITLSFDIDTQYAEPEGAELVYTLNGQEYHLPYDAGSVTLEDVPGGTLVNINANFPGYYVLDGWTSDATRVTATDTRNPLAVLIQNGGSVTKDQAYYYTGEDGVTYYFTAPFTGTVQWTGTDVTVYASGSAFTVAELSRQENITVHLTEKPTYTVTMKDISGSGEYSLTLPDGAGRAGNVVTVHEGDDLTVMVSPAQGKTVTYWETTPEGMDPVRSQATALRYIIPAIADNYTFEPIFSNTTYNTISWPTINPDTLGITLSPASGYLSSVVSGNDFVFHLSGVSSTLGMIDKVYANGHEFTEEGSEFGGTTYSYSGSTYTIKNITSNQVITLTLKDIGVTVNGEDISALSGAGWSYSPESQTLTLDRSNLTVSGSNNSLASDLHIMLGSAASAVTFSNFTLTSSHTLPIQLMSQESILTLTGNNFIDAPAAGAIPLSSVGNLTVRGSGNLAISSPASGGSPALSVAGALTLSGNVSLDIPISGAGNFAVSAQSLVVGVAQSSFSPIMRVSAENYNYGIKADTVTVYGGELNVKAFQHAIYARSLTNLNGTMELSTSPSSTDNTVFACSNLDISGERSLWNVDYSAFGGFLLRIGVSDYYRLYTKMGAQDLLKLEYQIVGPEGDQTMQLVPVWQDNLSQAFYVRLSPMKSSVSTLTLSATVDGKTYTGTPFNPPINIPTYYYVDLADSSSTAIQSISLPALEGSGVPVPSTGTPNWLIVAKADQTGYLTLGTWEITWNEPVEENPRITGTPTESAKQLDYTLSGMSELDITMRGSIDASSQAVKSLTLDSLGYSNLKVNDNPVYLKGSNTLITVSSVSAPLEAAGDNHELNLQSADSTAGLMLSSIDLADTVPALIADSVNLHNVQSLTIFVQQGAYAIKSSQDTTNVIIQYYDDTTGSSPLLLPYGTGWHQEVGTSAAAADVTPNVQLSLPVPYMKFSTISSDAYVSVVAPNPSDFYYNKSTGTGVTQHTLIPPVVTGQVHPFDKAAAGNASSGSVAVIDSSGAETPLTATQYTATTPDGTTSTLLTLEESWLETLPRGTYTIRVYFYDEDLSDSTRYTLDIPLTIEETAVSIGELSISPDTVTGLRGSSFDFTTTFTGTTPAAYEWSVTGDGDLTENRSSATLTIFDDAEVGSTISVEVSSYADTAKTHILGTATATITVAPTALDINVSCVYETPSGDGSYTLYHNTDGNAHTWNFAAEVILDSGTPEPQRLSWTLWGAQRSGTQVDASTGVLTISPDETGTNGQLQLNAIYENPDGSIYKKTVIIHLSTDAHVAYDSAPAANGVISGAVLDDGTVIPADGAFVPAGRLVTITAAPDEEFAVKTWYVNGQDVMDNPLYTVDAENHTLSFVAEAMLHYTIRADYVNTNNFAITYSAGKNGSLTAQSGGQILASGSTVVKGSDVVLTATPDTHCSVARWLVNGTVYEQTPGTPYTGKSLTLSNVEENYDIAVEFVGSEIEIRFDAQTGGTLTLLVNGQRIENASGSFTVHAMDDVLLLAAPDSGYLVDCWSASDGSGGYAPIPGSSGTTTYSVPDITEGFDVQVSFRPIPTYDITVTTNSFQNGYGTVESSYGSVDMSDSSTLTVAEHGTLTLLAVPDAGSYVYRWYVPDGVEYEVNGNSITLLDVRSDLDDIDAGQYIGVTFRRNFYDVTLSATAGGTLSAQYALTIGTDDFNGSISDSENIRGGSKVDFTITPDKGYILSGLTVNGSSITPVWHEDLGFYTYSIDSLGSDVLMEAVFAETPSRHAVIVPSAFTAEVVTDDSVDPPVTASIPTGSGSVSFVPDGVSGDDDNAAPGTDAVLAAPGGTVRLTFSPAAGYAVDYNVLVEEIEKVIPEISAAVYSLSMAVQDCVVTITGVDSDLDFSDMESPFSPDLVTAYCTISIADDVTGGTLEVYWNNVQLQDGAQVPEGSKLTVVATPNEHFDVDLLTADGHELSETTFTVDSDTTLDAQFARSEYDVTVSISGNGSGLVSINGTEYAPGTYTLAAGSTLTIQGLPAQGSALSVLDVPGGTLNPDDGSWSVSLTSDLTISALFEAEECAVTFNTPENGTLILLDSLGRPIQSGDFLPVGTTLTIMTIPDAHYALDTLTAGGSDYGTNLLSSVTTYLVNAEKSNHIECTFAVAEVPVSWTVSNGVLNVTQSDGTPIFNGQYLPVGTTLIVKPIANTDYTLESFTASGAEADSEGKYVTGTEPVIFTVLFKYTGEIPTGPEGPAGPVGPAGPGLDSDSEYTVKISVTGAGSVTVTSDGVELANGDTVKLGTILVITATAEGKDPLTSLTVNGVPFVSGSEYEVYANTDIVASFGDVGQPYYLDASGNKVFIGFAYDIDGSGTWTEGEYLAPEGAQVLFTPNHKTFSDVSGHWGEEAIAFVTDREILIGITDSLFDPDGSVTRAMVATVLGRLYERSFGLSSTGTGQAFDDCNYSAYYGKYVDWAAEHGIVKGYGDGTFGPDDLVTREQMATMLFRFAEMMQALPEQTDSALTYADSDTIADWAREGALYCQSEGLMQGVGANLFAPQQTATRAQLATIVSNFIKTVVR